MRAGAVEGEAAVVQLEGGQRSGGGGVDGADEELRAVVGVEDGDGVDGVVAGFAVEVLGCEVEGFVRFDVVAGDGACGSEGREGGAEEGGEVHFFFFFWR